MKTSLPVIFVATHFQSNLTKFNDPVKYPENSITRLRTTTSYELELFLTDSGTIYLNGQSYQRKKGSILLAFPNDKRQSSLHYESIIIRFDVLDVAIRELLNSIKGVHYNLDFEKSYTFFTNTCTDFLRFESDHDIQLAAQLILFLCDIRKTIFHNTGDHEVPHISHVNRAINYMKDHYREDIGVSDIANFCCLSNSHFYKIFMDTVHITPTNYLIDIRLTHAKSLLVTTTFSISEIASMCGFNSSTYFGDCFKRAFSVTPREFRKSLIHPDL